MSATASPPTGSPRQYSPALRRGTTGFGMGPGGSAALAATDIPDPPDPGAQAASRRTLLPCGPPPRPRERATRRAGADGPRWRASAGRSVSTHRASRTTTRLGPRGRGPRVGQSPSAIRTARLRSVTRRPPAAYPPGRLPGALPGAPSGEPGLGGGFPLRCFQRFARPDVATQPCRGRDNWPTSGPSTPVLSY